MLGYFQSKSQETFPGIPAIVSTPVCASYCENWFNACKDDRTCVYDATKGKNFILKSPDTDYQMEAQILGTLVHIDYFMESTFTMFSSLILDLAENLGQKPKVVEEYLVPSKAKVKIRCHLPEHIQIHLN